MNTVVENLMALQHAVADPCEWRTGASPDPWQPRGCVLDKLTVILGIPRVQMDSWRFGMLRYETLAATDEAWYLARASRVVGRVPVPNTDMITQRILGMNDTSSHPEVLAWCHRAVALAKEDAQEHEK
jgi:hypothetical protein